jgi:hypothetical protein
MAVKRKMKASVLTGNLFIQTVGFVYFFSKNNKKKTEELEKEEEYKNSLLCRFVLDGIGKTIGESVAVDEDILIIKSKNKYLGVPLKHIEEDGKTLLVKGLVDHFNAEKMGEKWREGNFKEISHDVDEE